MSLQHWKNLWRATTTPVEKNALYDYLVEYYTGAGFDEDYIADGYANSSEEDLLYSFLSIFHD